MSGGTSTAPTADRLGDGCEHLVVVAGLPCSGKTYLMEALRAGQADEVPEMLRPSPEGCAFLAVRDADPARVRGRALPEC